MARGQLPAYTDQSSPVSLRPQGGPTPYDASGLVSGVAQLARGVQEGAQGFVQAEAIKRDREAAVDVAKAEAKWTRDYLDIGNQFDQDGDYSTFTERAGAQIDESAQNAAVLIRDDRAREKWLADVSIRKLGIVDAITDKGRALSEQADQVSLENAIADSAQLISDPTVPEEVRKKARADVLGTITMAINSGLLTPAGGNAFIKTYLDGSESQLAWNRLQSDVINGDAHQVMAGTGISTSLGTGDIASAAIAVGKGIVAIDPAAAATAAAMLGDKAFPTDPALAAAYLKDPETNQKYAKAALDALTKQYKGDMTAALIAIAPGGGEELADKWVKSKHDETVLPSSVRTYYLDVMEKVAPPKDANPLPIVTAPGVSIEDTDVAVLDRFEKLQTTFGVSIPIISATRDPDHNAAVGGVKGSMHIERRALDLDLSKLSQDEKVRLIEMASAMGFTGIGVYANSMHIDTGNRRAWGKGNGAVPGWAQEAISKHLAGDLTEVVPGNANVDPRYQALTFDQRLRGYDIAKTAAAQQNMDYRAGLAVAAENAPAAIASTGTYSGTMPTAEEFVRAYGAAEGIDRFKTFDAAVAVANTTYGMKTMSNDQILAVTQDAVPTSSGDDAALEAKKYDAISQAAAATLKARTDDPASYVMQAFPNVSQAWADLSKAGNDPEAQQAAFGKAISSMAEAQQKLGITDMQLLPKAMAAAAAVTFNNAELTQPERLGALTHLVFGTQNEDQQKAIFDQMVKSGVPAYTQAAMDAMIRGDQAGATYLFRAALIDPKDLPLPEGVTGPAISTRIGLLNLDEGTIGDVIYGMTDGLAGGMERAALDMALFERAVKLRLVDGSATGIDQAVALTQKDMYGDVRVVEGRGWNHSADVKITLPKDEDDAPLRAGFDSLLGKVGEAIRDDMTPALASEDNSEGQAAILASGRDMYVQDAIATGYFTNAGNDRYVFIDHKGLRVDEPGGDQPLLFTKADVIKAGASNPVAPALRTGWSPTMFGLFPK